jgi:hypothetical protein
MYKLLAVGFVRKLDGTINSIPMVDGNKDYKGYKDWLALGNTPKPEFTDAELLTNAQTTQKALLVTDYNTALTQDIAYMRTTFQAGTGSLGLITQVLAVGSIPSGFYWRDKANNNVAMTYVQLQGLASAIQTRGLGYYTNLQTLKVQIANATTVTAVQSVIWG